MRDSPKIKELKYEGFYKIIEIFWTMLVLFAGEVIEFVELKIEFRE